MRLRIFSASSGGECLLSRENNQYNIYNKIQRFVRTKTLCVKQAFCKGNNKIQQLREDMCRTEFPAEEENNKIQHLQDNTTLRGDVNRYFLISKCW